MLARDIEKLIDCYGTDIYRFCLKLCMHKANAEDLYQQTFLRMMEIEMEMNWQDHPKTFLFSVANSIWKNDIRKKARHERIAPTMTISEVTENYVKDDGNLQQEVLDGIRNDSLLTCIQELPDKLRVPVELYYSFEYSLKDIATIMQIPTGTIKSRLAKARKIMKRRLEELGYETI